MNDEYEDEDEDEPEEIFVCYFCKDWGDHGHCIGVPCMCPCPGPDEIRRSQIREAALAKLSDEERWALGVS